MKIKLFLLSLIIFASCERVAPNYYGVLMQNFGKNGKLDYSAAKGRVSTIAPGTELFQVPAFEQRADFGDNTLLLKDADNTEFTAKPLYSYKVIEDSVVTVVFQNSMLGSGSDFMENLENNILEPHIHDIIKKESKKYTTELLMASGASLKFEDTLDQLVAESFQKKGLELVTFSANLDFTNKVKEKIDQRNEVNTTISVLDQEILAQEKRNYLLKLQAEGNLILSKGITPELLQKQFIEKWDGKTPIYGSIPSVMKVIKD